MQTSRISRSPAYRVVSIAVLTAVTAVFTLLVRIPIAPTRGYINLGDVAIFFTAFTFGPVTALLSGGLGTAIADLLAGYAQWAPITLVIHGLQGLVAGLVVRGMVARPTRLTAASGEEESAEELEAGVRNPLPLLAVIVAGILGTVIMAGLYFLAAGIMYGFGPAAVEIPGNLIQNVVGIIGGVLLSKTVLRAYPPVQDLYL